jgi:hypothetical protein
MSASAPALERRDAALREAESARRGIDEIAEALAGARGAYAHRLTRHLALYRGALGEALDRYARDLPRPALARCPFSREEARHSVDTVGLDGPWWDYHRPARPAERLPSTWVAMTGALSPAGPVAPRSFLAVPGPGVPYVIPRLLGQDSVRAVIARVAVGAHRGYAISYFVDPQADAEVLPVNTWGSAEHRVTDASGVEWRRDLPHGDADHDFALGPWIERGALQWVAPGDEGAELRSGIAGCPYLDLDGGRLTQHVQDGEMWTTSRSGRTAPGAAE